MSGEHSIIPPSSANIWGSKNGCTGWVPMNQAVPQPDEETQDQAEGTAGHEVGASRILKVIRGGVGPSLAIGETASNGVIITDEIFDAAEIYADDFTRAWQRHILDGGVKYGIEQKLHAPSIHPQSFGTSDSWLYNPKARLIIIWDYKYGHVVVDAFENLQGVNYATGIIDELGLRNVEDLTVEIRIRQPRANRQKGVLTDWQVKKPALEKLMKQLSEKAYLALSPGARLQTGPHCRRCNCRHACEPALAAGTSLYEMSGQPVPIELSVAALGLQLAIVTRAREQLKGLESGYQEQIMALIKGGARVPWWGTDVSYSREAWNKPREEVLRLGQILGHDLTKPIAKTPNQARQMGIDDKVLAAYSGRTSGLKLVYDNGEKARKVFTTED